MIVLRRWGGLGDVAMALCAAKAIHQTTGERPGFITSEIYWPLVDACPHVIRVDPTSIATDLGPASHGLGTMHEVDSFIETIGKDLTGENRAKLFATRPEDRTLDLAVPLADAAEVYGMDLNPGKKKILLHAGRTDPNRTVPVETWSEVAKTLIGLGHQVILIGARDAADGRGAQDVQAEGLVDARDRLSLLGLVALMGRSDVLVSNDSGPIQLAGATGIGIVGVYSVVGGKARLPMGNRSVSVGSWCPMFPCYSKMNDKAVWDRHREANPGQTTGQIFASWCPAESGFGCMAKISVQSVVDACVKLLEEPGPKLSVAMIVRNESVLLGRCLSSLTGMDELVVVDTGSKDGTVEIARGFGARIGYYQWNDDFSAARNHALALCTGDWILSIDADEFLEPGGVERLRWMARRAAETTESIKISLRPDGGHGSAFRNTRFFRRGLKFSGRIHENIAAQTCAEAPDPAPTIVYGTSPAHALDTDRNYRMLKAAYESDPSARHCYYFAREYWYRKEYENAVRIFEECTRKSAWTAERADAHLYVAQCHWNLARGDEARRACMDALTVNPNFAEAARFMAEIVWPHHRQRWLDFAATATNDDVLFIR